MEYFIIALIAVIWGWREFVKSMRLNTIEQELEGIRIWNEKKDQPFLEIQNQVKVLVQNGTIPHEQEAKYSGSQVLIKPASNGTGVKAGGAMRAVLESAGVHDVLAKSKGSSNPHNLVKATMKALTELRDAKQVASQRGVNLETVFNG